MPERFGLAPDPDDARRWRERLAAAGLDERELGSDGADVVWLACVHVPYLAMLALLDPGRLVRAARDPYLRRPKPKERSAAELAEALAGVADAADLRRRLRAYRAQEYIRLGA